MTPFGKLEKCYCQQYCVTVTDFTVIDRDHIDIKSV